MRNLVGALSQNAHKVQGLDGRPTIMFVYYDLRSVLHLWDRNEGAEGRCEGTVSGRKGGSASGSRSCRSRGTPSRSFLFPFS